MARRLFRRRGGHGHDNRLFCLTHLEEDARKALYAFSGQVQHALRNADITDRQNLGLVIFVYLEIFRLSCQALGTGDAENVTVEGKRKFVHFNRIGCNDVYPGILQYAE